MFYVQCWFSRRSIYLHNCISESYRFWNAVEKIECLSHFGVVCVIRMLVTFVKSQYVSRSHEVIFSLFDSQWSFIYFHLVNMNFPNWSAFLSLVCRSSLEPSFLGMNRHYNADRLYFFSFLLIKFSFHFNKLTWLPFIFWITNIFLWGKAIIFSYLQID